MVFLTGYYGLGDGGQGKFVWVADSLQEDDGGAYIKPHGVSDITPGRWHRLFDDNSEVPVTFWGAIPGITDVSAQIAKADTWCARFGDAQTGTTLVFTAGTYSIGAGVVVDLEAVGLIAAGLERPVHYKIKQNARFSGSISSGVRFLGPTTVESDGYIWDFVRITNTVDGYVRPEWWGAIGNGIADDSTAFKNCAERSGDLAVLMVGTYVCSEDIVAVAKAYNFIEGAWILANPAGAGSVTVGKVEHTGDTCFFGDLSKFTFTYKKYYSSMFSFDDISINALDGTFTLVWDTTHTFTGNYTNANITHDLTMSQWTVGANNVAIKDAILADRRHFFYGATGAGSVNVTALPVIKAVWFGNTNAFNFQLMLNSAIAGQQSVDGQNIAFVLGSATGYVVTHDLVIRDIKLTSPAGFNALTFTGAGSVTFMHSHLAFNGKVSDLFVESLTTSTKFIGCELKNGFFTIRGTSAEVRDCVIDQCTMNIYSGSGVKVVKSNTVLNSVFKAHSAAGLLNSIYFLRNTFRSSISSLPGFIHLIPVNGPNAMYNVLVEGNSYYYIGLANPSNLVIEGDAGVLNYWSDSAAHDLIVREEYAKGPETNTGITGNVALQFTHGDFAYFTDTPTYISAPRHIRFDLFGTRPVEIPNAALSNLFIEGVTFLGDGVDGVTPMSGRPAAVVPLNSTPTAPSIQLHYIEDPAIPVDIWYFQLKVRVWWS
jgi:hypothetical protein